MKAVARKNETPGVADLFTISTVPDEKV